MNQDISFKYSYSAKENKEVQEIRKKYLPCEESKFEELKRLDRTVQASGIKESLCVGIISALVFGIGMCLTMQVIGFGMFFIVLGVFLGVIGMFGMLLSYIVHRRIFEKNKQKFAPRILALTLELSGENNKS